MCDDSARDHLFISYASEDGALAEWLTLKLTSMGYRVWCDRFKLFGGESYPVDIDEAIKNRTFRVLGLLSRHSVSKPNPVKERTLALNIARERNSDFFIPLNVDGLSATELPWMTSDLTFIPFEDWANGLNRLLKKLKALDAPRPLAPDDGSRAAIEAFFPPSVVTGEYETLYSNCFEFVRVPDIVKCLMFDGSLAARDESALLHRWAFYKVDSTTLLAFEDPPADISRRLNLVRSIKVHWRNVDAIKAIRSTNVITALLKRSLLRKAVEKGMRFDEASGRMYFPQGLLEDNRIKYTNYRGRKTRLAVIGERKSRARPYRYHTALSFWIRRDVTDGWAALLTVHLHITDSAGRELAARSAFARRKNVTGSWWNHQWLTRLLAICHFLSDGTDQIIVGTVPDEQVVLSASPIQPAAPMRLDEARLSALLRGEYVPAARLAEDDDE